jgi:hypothetical protein
MFPQLQGLLRQALAMLTRRSKKATLPHVVVKYSRRDKQHVAKVIVTESPYPVVCPHGFDRDSEEWCQVSIAICRVCMYMHVYIYMRVCMFYVYVLYVHMYDV